MFRASGSAKSPGSFVAITASSTSAAAFGVGSSTVNVGLPFSNIGDCGASMLVSGVCSEPSLPKLSVSMCSRGGSCGGDSFISSTGRTFEGFRFFARRRDVLLQLRPSPRGWPAAVSAKEGLGDLGDEGVELRRNSGFRRALKSPITPCSSSCNLYSSSLSYYHHHQLAVISQEPAKLRAACNGAGN